MSNHLIDLLKKIPGERDLQQQNYSCDAVIVNYNSGGFLASCLASTITLRLDHVIVVDNASHDNSLEHLKELCPDGFLKIIQNTHNLGFAAACNIGAKASTAQYLLFLNPDCTLEPDALQRMMSVLESESSIGMVGGLLCNLDGSEQPGGRRVFPTPRRAFMRAFGLAGLAKLSPRFFSDFLMHHEPLPTRPIAVEAISGACMLVKRDAIEKVGLWDEGYFLHCEDLDWCMRFNQNGLRIMFVPDAKVFHAWGACSRSRPIFVEWHKHKGMIRFYQKFFRHQYPGLLMALVNVGVWLRFGLVITCHFLKLAGRAIGFGRG
jgi:GT2 family glycosyltransferase